MSNKFFTSPKGRASYPKLTKPDTKFKAEGEYSVSLLVPKEDAEALVEQIKEAFTEEFGAKKLDKMIAPFKEDENGDIVFKFKSKNKPALFDAAGKPILPSVDPKVGNGSVMKVRGSIGLNLVQAKYYVSLYLNQVQIIDLVEYAGGGFKAEEGSYRAERDTAGESDAPSAFAEDF